MVPFAGLGLSNDRIQTVERLLALMKESTPMDEIAFVESEISWAKGHKEIALSLLRNLVNKESSTVTMKAMSARYNFFFMIRKHD